MKNINHNIFILFLFVISALLVCCTSAIDCQEPAFWNRYNPVLLGYSKYKLYGLPIKPPLLVIDSPHCYNGHFAYRYRTTGIEMPFYGDNHRVFKVGERIMLETAPLSDTPYHDTIVLFDFSLRPRLDTLKISSPWLLNITGNGQEYFLLFIDEKFYSKKYYDTLYQFGMRNVLGDYDVPISCHFWVGKNVGIVSEALLLPKRNPSKIGDYYTVKRYGDTLFPFSADSVLIRGWRKYAQSQGITMEQLYQAFEICPAINIHIWNNGDSHRCDSIDLPMFKH